MILNINITKALTDASVCDAIRAAAASTRRESDTRRGASCGCR